jgi:hypothetical protein
MNFNKKEMAGLRAAFQKTHDYNRLPAKAASVAFTLTQPMKIAI